jgi:ABC-type uncharacterized transport system substrate-binding protein
MQDALKRYAADLQRAEGIPIAIRVGLNSGEVVVRSIGSDLHIDLAAQHKLPGLYPYRVVVDSGGLMAYDSYTPDLVARTATYVDKILRRMKPVDLPVEQPTKFELVINLKTAKALGLTIPPSRLARADQVIEH